MTTPIPNSTPVRFEAEARALLTVDAEGVVDLEASLGRLERARDEAKATFHRSTSFRRAHSGEVGFLEREEWRDDDDRYWDSYQALLKAAERVKEALECGERLVLDTAPR
jgi:hypothetical protein